MRRDDILKEVGIFVIGLLMLLFFLGRIEEYKPEMIGIIVGACICENSIRKILDKEDYL